MRAIGLIVISAAVAAGIGSPAAAQQGERAADRTPKIYTSAADITAMMAKAKAERKSDQANYSQPILLLAPYRANLEYRAIAGPSAVHEKDAEVFYVIDGAATMVTGGTLKGTTIENGNSRHVAKGDFIIVPENTPHGFSQIDRAPLVLMTLHVPRTGTPAPPAGQADRAPKIFTSAADITAMMAKAKAERKPDQANYSQPIILLAPYRENLEYRAIVGPSAVHEKDAEVFYVIDGAATMVTGGTLKGTTIENGNSRRVAKGDFIVVPENTPHGFSAIDSAPLVLMTLHVPRGE